VSLLKPLAYDERYDSNYRLSTGCTKKTRAKVGHCLPKSRAK